MTEQELLEIVLAALSKVAPEVDPATIDPAAPLSDQIYLDSMDFLNIVVAIHQQTGIDVPERDYPRLGSLQDAVAYLSRAQQRR